MSSHSISRTHFFTFSPGELQRHEFDQFFSKLTCTLDKAQGLAIIMNPLDDLVLNAPLLSRLSPSHADFHSIHQGAMHYDDWSRVESDLWLLMNQQEPELIFNCRAPFDSLMRTLRKAYAPSPGSSQGSSVIEVLLQEFSPLLFYLLGEVSLLTPAVPAHA